MLRLESPWMLLLLLLIPAAMVWSSRTGRPAALRFSSTADLRALRGSLRQSLVLAPSALRAISLILLVVALARPQMGTERIRDISRGIAIEMVVDRSSSMGAEMRYKGRASNRLEAVKAIFEDFVDPEGELPGRPNDLIGMVTFARYPDTICPLTLSHTTLTELIGTVELVEQRSEDGTAIGDAVALAAARLEQAEETLARKMGEESSYDIKSKVIILLTDGENNAGDRSVAEAGELAAKWGVKIYAIGVGDDRRMSTPFGSINMPKTPGVDDKSLQGLADATGGVYRLAVDSSSLVDVYREIDQLERSEIQAVRYLDYRELYLPFALLGLVLLMLEALLRNTALRTIP